MPRTLNMTPSTRITSPFVVLSTQGDAEPRAVPGATSQRISTEPARTLDAPGQLRPRQTAGDAGDEGVGDPHGTVRRGEGRLQHVGARQVAPAGGEILDRAQLDPTTVLDVEEPGEHR